MIKVKSRLNSTTRQTTVGESDVVNGDVAGLVEDPGAFKYDGEVLRHPTHCDDARLPNIFVVFRLPPQCGCLGALNHHHIQLSFICMKCPRFNLESMFVESIMLATLAHGRNTFSVHVVVKMQSAAGAGLFHSGALQSCGTYFLSFLRF